MRPVFAHVAARADADVGELVEMGIAPDELPVRSGNPECEVLRLVRDERPALALVGGGHRGASSKRCWEVSAPALRMTPRVQ